MNFLLHRELANRELSCPLAGVGAMLPDLWRLAGGRVRDAQLVPVAGDEGVNALVRGVAHHLEADRWFHQTEVFRAGERDTVAALGAPQLTARKLTLFAHVCWEMCLDGALLCERGLTAHLAELCHDLDAAGPSMQIAAAERCLCSGGDMLSGGELNGRMAKLMSGVRSGALISGYQSGHGLAVRLAGLRGHLGLPPVASGERVALEQALEARLHAAKPALVELLADRARYCEERDD